MFASHATLADFELHVIPPQVTRLLNAHSPFHIISEATLRSMSLLLLEANSFINAVRPKQSQTCLDVVALLLKEASSWITTISINIRRHVV